MRHVVQQDERWSATLLSRKGESVSPHKRRVCTSHGVFRKTFERAMPACEFMVFANEKDTKTQRNAASNHT
jgi:hypothetical protein